MVPPDGHWSVGLLTVAGYDERELLISLFGGRYRAEYELGRDSPHQSVTTCTLPLHRDHPEPRT